VRRHGAYPEVSWVDGAMRVQSPWPPLAPDVEQAMRQTWGSWSTCCAETGPDAPDRARFIAAYDGLAERERQDLVSGQALPAPTSPALQLAQQNNGAARKAPVSSKGAAASVPGAAHGTPEAVKPAAAPADIPPPPPRPAAPPPREHRRWSAEELDAELARLGGTP
jgi:hypothetical protein